MVRLLLVSALLAAGCAAPPPAPTQTGPSCEAIPGLEVVFLEAPQAEALADGGLDGIEDRVVYPETARRDRVEGPVLVAFAVGPDGRVLCTDAVEAPDPRLAEAARRAVYGTPFEPYRVDGRAVAFGSRLPLVFAILDGERIVFPR